MKKIGIALILTLLLSLTLISSSKAQIVKIPGAALTITGVRVIYHIPNLTDEFFVDYFNLTPSVSNGSLVLSDGVTWSAVYAPGSWTRIERLSVTN